MGHELVNWVRGLAFEKNWKTWKLENLENIGLSSLLSLLLVTHTKEKKKHWFLPILSY